mmetsp:Transcript_2984/g.7357  ORF Transcript_2984/g.7357 Transcript_2984/m.7357 type:complete len:105 (-) Transcript_2984:663-977(-)
MSIGTRADYSHLPSLRTRWDNLAIHVTLHVISSHVNPVKGCFNTMHYTPGKTGALGIHHIPNSSALLLQDHGSHSEHGPSNRCYMCCYMQSLFSGFRFLHQMGM